MMARLGLIALALLSLATPTWALHDLGPDATHRVCWGDAWGLYDMTVVPNPVDPHRITVTALHHYEGFIANGDGTGQRNLETGVASFRLALFAHGLDITILANVYHTLAAGTAHYYYYFDHQRVYGIYPIWPEPCP